MRCCGKPTCFAYSLIFKYLGISLDPKLETLILTHLFECQQCFSFVPALSRANLLYRKHSGKEIVIYFFLYFFLFYERGNQRMEFFYLYFDDVLLMNYLTLNLCVFNAKPVEQGGMPLARFFDENTCWSTTPIFDQFSVLLENTYRASNHAGFHDLCPNTKLVYFCPVSEKIMPHDSYDLWKNRLAQKRNIEGLFSPFVAEQRAVISNRLSSSIYCIVCNVRVM